MNRTPFAFLSGILIWTFVSTSYANPKSPKEWAVWLQSPDAAKRRIALFELARMGKQAQQVKDAVYQQLQHTSYIVRDEAARTFAFVVSQKSRWFLKLCRSQKAKLRAAAAVIFRYIKKPDSKVMKCQLGLLGDKSWDVRHRSYTSLSSKGVRALPWLIPTIKRGNRWSRKQAGRLLASIEPRTPALITTLIQALQGYYTNRYARLGLYRAGQAAVPFLLKALLKTKDENKKLALLAAIGYMGPKAHKAIPTLLPLLGASQQRVRSQTAEVLGKLGKQAFHALAKALKSPNPNVRTYALKGLHYHYPKTQTVLPQLLRALRSKHDAERVAAATELSYLGIRAKSLELKLLFALNDKNPNVRSWIASALGRIRPSQKQTLSALYAKVSDKVSQVQYEVYKAIAASDITSNERNQKLVACLSSKKTAIQVLCAKALGRSSQQEHSAFQALKKLSSSKSPRKVRVAAIRALGRFGKKALPALYPLLKDSNRRIRVAAIKALKHQKPSHKLLTHLMMMLADKVYRVKKQAFKVLLTYKGHAAKAVIKKIPSIKNSSIKEWLLEVMGSTGTESLHHIVRAYPTSNTTTRVFLARALRYAACDSYGRAPTFSKKSLALLVRIGNSSQQASRKSVARTLGCLKKHGVHLAAKLAHLLKEKNHSIVSTMVSSLARHKVTQQSLVKELVRLYQQHPKDSRFRSTILQALNHSSAHQKLTSPVYKDALQNSSYSIRFYALQSLKHYGAKAAPFTPLISKQLQDQRTARVAAQVLGSIGSKAQQAIPALLQASSHPRNGVRETAVEALSNIKTEPKRILPILQLRLWDVESRVQYAASKALFAYKSKALPTIRQLLRHPFHKIRIHTLIPLREAERWALPLQPLLVPFLSSKRCMERMFSLHGMARLSPNHPKTQLALKKGLSDPCIHVQTAAIQELRKQGQKSRSIPPLLLQRKRQKGWIARSEALRVMAEIEPQSKRVLQLLFDALQSSDKDVRYKAAGILRWMKKKAKSAIPHLQQATHDTNASVRSEAILAIHAISPNHPSLGRLTPIACGDSSYRVRQAMEKILKKPCKNLKR